mmetsp:Transcript_1243/g.1735  ORF Transcript_1243/g.1735 Transcript_1243/m.1735 type:complete len:204 (+) Transcript_1243:701-1312(+)
MCAFTVFASRRSSNLDRILMSIMPYFSTKCLAISPTEPPVTITFTPLSAIALMLASIIFSSLLLYSSNSSASLMRTVPFVSVVAVSIAHVNTATLASSTLFTDVSVSRLTTTPRITSEFCTLPPIILQVRTLSTLKFLAFLGITHMQASAIRGFRMCTEVNCFEHRDAKVAVLMVSLLVRSFASTFQVTRSSNEAIATSAACT